MAVEKVLVPGQGKERGRIVVIGNVGDQGPERGFVLLHEGWVELGQDLEMG